MAKAQRAVEARAILQTYESAGAMARFAPEALGVLDHAGALRRVAEVLAVPPHLVRSPEAVAEQQQQQAMQAGLGQLAQLAQQGGAAAKDLATAAASAAGVPGGAGMPGAGSEPAPSGETAGARQADIMTQPASRG